MEQPHGTREADAGRLHACHFAADAAQRRQHRFRAEPAAIDRHTRTRPSPFVHARIPLRGDTALGEPGGQCLQYLAIVELPFARHEPARREASGQRGLGGREGRPVDAGETPIGEQRGRRVGAHAPLEQRRLGAIAVMPDDERAVALKEDGFGQRADDARPFIERGRAELDDERLGNGGLGKRREHRSRHPCGRTGARRIAALVERDAVAGAGEPPRDEAAAQATAEHGEIGLRARQND
jgi:hypothetical protein